MDIEETRERLLLATLPHVAFDGWTWAAIRAGARDLDLERVQAENAVPGGEDELLEYFNAWADRRMLEELEARDLASLRVSDRITTAVRVHLEILEPYREAVRRSLAVFALPTQAALGMRCLYRSVDAIWHAAGDTATDYNFYTKRLLLAAVYSSTLLVWLNDRSEDHAVTWTFLERRMGEVLKIGGRADRAMKSLLAGPERLLERRKRPDLRRR